MSIKDKFEYCAHCSKSTFSMEDGRRCSLTGRGPEFENRCEHFDGDEAEVEKAIKDEQRAVEESVGIHGFSRFLLVLLRDWGNHSYNHQHFDLPRIFFGDIFGQQVVAGVRHPDVGCFCRDWGVYCDRFLQEVAECGGACQDSSDLACCD